MGDKTAKDRVMEWLDKSGYPLEMEVAAVLHEKGFSVTPSFIYTDDDTGKNREIDLLATNKEVMGFTHVGFVIECKSTQNPWVVFKSKNKDEYVNLSLGLGLHTETAKPALDRLRSEPGNIKWLIQRRGIFGYGLREASSGQNDSAYSISVSLARASGAWLSSSSLASPRVAFAFPVLIVDAPIFECSLDDKNKITLNEVQESFFVFSPSGQPSCVIRVIHRCLLREFAAYADELSKEIHKELRTDLDIWLRSLGKNP